jgi:L-ascorbate metabolism protein UlaG (beta-lactamase superfamily)
VTDPILRERIVHLQRTVPLVEGIADGVSAILISHLHHDHLDLPSLARIDHQVPVVIAPGARSALGRRTRRPVVELAPGESVTLDGVEIRATPAAHDGRRPGRRGVWAPPLGFVVTRGGRSVYFAGDTDRFDEMSTLAPALTCALVPIWGWGRTLGPGHMDPEGAAEAVRILRPLIAVPIHWGTYRTRVGRRVASQGVAPPEARFLAAATRLAPDVDLRIVAPGGRVELDGGTADRSGAPSAPVRWTS